jgi:hypothetical protein
MVGLLVAAVYLLLEQSYGHDVCTLFCLPESWVEKGTNVNLSCIIYNNCSYVSNHR